MDAKERARRFREHQELVSKVVKQQEDIKKKRRQKLTGEEAFERKQEKFFKPLLKTSQEKIIDVSTVPTIKYTPRKLQMLKDFSQMTEEELEQLEYDDEGLFQQLGEINQPPDYIVNALQNNEYSADSKTKAGLIPTEQPAIFHLVQEKVLIFNDELRFLSSAQPPVKLTPRLMFLLTKDGRQGSTVRDESKYIDKPLDMKNNDDRVYIDLLNSVDYRVILSGKSRKNEKEKHIIQALSRLGSGVSFLPNDPSQLVNRLLLLLGSKKAGNNNCFNEASAILDQLMNMKIINKYQYKDILSHIK